MDLGLLVAAVVALAGALLALLALPSRAAVEDDQSTPASSDGAAPAATDAEAMGATTAVSID